MESTGRRTCARGKLEYRSGDVFVLQIVLRVSHSLPSLLRSGHNAYFVVVDKSCFEPAAHKDTTFQAGAPEDNAATSISRV
jgi:hypothetical protein